MLLSSAQYKSHFPKSNQQVLYRMTRPVFDIQVLSLATVASTTLQGAFKDIVFAKVSCRVTWPKTSLRCLTVESRGAWYPTSVAISFYTRGRNNCQTLWSCWMLLYKCQENNTKESLVYDYCLLLKNGFHSSSKTWKEEKVGGWGGRSVKLTMSFKFRNK